MTVALVLGLAAFSSPAYAEDLKTVRIGFPSSGKNWNTGVLGEANYKGYLDEYLNPLGYKAEVTGFVGAAPALHEALAAGDLDLVDYAGFAGILGKSRGIDTTLLAVTDYSSPWRLVASASSGINDIEDLKGKKVAYQRGATTQMYLVKVLEQAGLSFDDIEAVNAALPDGLSSASTGAVDAAVVSAGQEQQLADEGLVKVIHSGTEADPATFYEPMVLAGSTSFVRDNPDVVVAVLKALLKAKADIVADPEAFYELSAEQSGVPLNVVKATAIDDQDTAHPMVLNEAYLGSISRIQDFELANGITTSGVDLDSWARASYLKRAVEEYGSDGSGTNGEQLADAAVGGAATADGAPAQGASSKGDFARQVAVIALVVAVIAAITLARHAAARNAAVPAAARHALDVLFGLILPALVVLAWHLATSSGTFSTVVLPSISSVAGTLVAQLGGGTFVGDIAVSVTRILKGYALAVVFGIFFGVVMGMSRSANRFFSLAFQAVRQIPMMAWVPLLVIWFGIGEASKVAVIFLASFFPILVNTIDGIRRTDERLVEVGAMYRLSRWRMFREIYLPSALPSIFVGLKLALGISWMAVVGAEMIAASSGIGFRINDARVLMDYPVVFAGMVAIAVTGVVMDVILSVISRVATPWQTTRR